MESVPDQFRSLLAKASRLYCLSWPLLKIPFGSDNCGHVGEEFWGFVREPWGEDPCHERVSLCPLGWTGGRAVCGLPGADSQLSSLVISFTPCRRIPGLGFSLQPWLGAGSPGWTASVVWRDARPLPLGTAAEARRWRLAGSWAGGGVMRGRPPVETLHEPRYRYDYTVGVTGYHIFVAGLTWMGRRVLTNFWSVGSPDQVLCRWATGRRVPLSPIYFWSLGSPEQVAVYHWVLSNFWSLGWPEQVAGYHWVLSTFGRWADLSGSIGSYLIFGRWAGLNRSPGTVEYGLFIPV